MSSLLNKLSSNAVPINCVWSKYSGCVCCGCEKKLVWGTIDTQSPKMIHSNNSDWYFNFHFYSQQAVCVVGRGRGYGKKHLYPPCPPPSRGNTVPYLSKIYGKPCTWWQEFSLELSFEAQSSLQIFWSFKFSFCMYLQWKWLESNKILEYFWHLCAIF